MMTNNTKISNTSIDERLNNLTPAKIAILKLKLEEKNGLINHVNSSPSINKNSSKSDFSDAYMHFQKWEKEFDSSRDICIDRHLVHKDKEENVLISRLAKIQDDFIIGEVFQNLSHNFFYEHPKDHVPGLYILEAARQFGTALSHLYYDVPFGTSFILNDLQARFDRFAETSLPLFIMAKISDKVYLNNNLFQLYNHAFFVQEQQVIAEVTGNFKIFEMTSYKKIKAGVTRSLSLTE